MSGYPSTTQSKTRGTNTNGSPGQHVTVPIADDEPPGFEEIEGGAAGGAPIDETPPTYEAQPEVEQYHSHGILLIANVLGVVGLGMGIAVFTVYSTVTRDDPEAFTTKTYLQLGGGLFVVVYFGMVLFLGCSSSSFISHLDNVLYEDQAAKLFGTMISGAPVIQYSIECYHYVTRTTGSGKDRRTRRQKRTTYSETIVLDYGSFIDKSPPPVAFPAGSKSLFLVVSCSQQYTIPDLNAQQYFDSQKFNLVERNKYRDRHFRTYETFTVPGFLPKVILKPRDTSNMSSPWGMKLVGRFQFLVASLCFLSWPYAMFLEKLADRATWLCLKSLGPQPIT